MSGRGALIAALALTACGEGGGGGDLLRATPSRLDFGAVAVGRARTRTLSFENYTERNLLIERLQAEPALRGIFEPIFPPRVLPRDGLEVQIDFRPSRPGQWVGDLRLEINPNEGLLPVVVPLTGSGVTGDLAARPNAVDFGRVRLGATATAAVTLENVGAAPVDLRAVSFDPQSAPELGGTLRGQLTLGPGEREEVVFSFSPSAEGEFRATARVATLGRESGGLAISLRGEGRTSALAAEPPTGVDFAGVFVGEETTRTVRVRNLTFEARRAVGVRLEGAPPGLRVTPPGPLDLGPGEERDLTLSFAPTRPGMTSAQLVLQASADDVLVLPVELSARGRSEPTPRLSAEVLDFGRVRIGDAPVRFVRLNVQPGLALPADTLVSVLPAGSPFRVLDFELPLAGGGQRRLEIEMRPLFPGRASARLQVGTATLALHGEGVREPTPALDVWPPALDFGPLARGPVGGRRFTVRNPGTAPLTELVARVEAPYRLAGPLPSTLAAGAAHDVFVELEDDRTIEGPRPGRLELGAAGGFGVAVPLAAEIRSPRSEPVDVEVRLRVGSGARADLHLLLGGAEVFSAPGDACFCNPQPDWGEADAERDDPHLRADLEVGPGEEVIRLEAAAASIYRVEVVQTGGLEAESEVEIYVRDHLVARQRRFLGPARRWVVGELRLPGPTASFDPAGLPLAVEPRRYCD